MCIGFVQLRAHIGKKITTPYIQQRIKRTLVNWVCTAKSLKMTTPYTQQSCKRTLVYWICSAKSLYRPKIYNPLNTKRSKRALVTFWVCSIESLYTVWKVISSDWRCQNVPLSITDVFVIDHKENVSLINHKMVSD